MASYAPEPNQDDEDEYAPPPIPATPAAPSKGASNATAAASSPGPSTGSAGAAPKTKSAPDRFISFDQWYNANSGAAENLAAQIGDKVNTAASGAKNDLNNAGNQFQQQVQAAGLSASPTVNERGGANQYQSQDATYSGPTDITQMAGYEDARSRAMNAGRQLNQLRSTEGIQALLPTQNSNRTANMFNAALAQRAGGERFQNLWNQFQGLDALPGTLQDTANTQVQAAKDQVAARNTESRNTAQRYTTNMNSQEPTEEAYRPNRGRRPGKDRFNSFEDFYGGNN